MNSRRLFVYLPIVFALLFSLGIYIGVKLNFSDHPQVIFFDKSRHNKINELLNYVEEQYVDTVSKERLVEETIEKLLHNLDPHSAYISAKDYKHANEALQGNFEGIGIEFNIHKDTLRVVAAISGGPSEKVGIKAGDKIIKVEDENIAGIGLRNNEVIEKLRGTEGTKVKVGILRNGLSPIQDYIITRGKIPLNSLDIAYMACPGIGYIKINRFSATTFEEYITAFHELNSLGMNRLILDLRENPGGYLNAAVELADEFLGKGKQIVYTQGRSQPKKVYKATKKGEFEKNPIVILIDEGSASASEIIAGAIQDNDRGIIIGRRSFGKGLVQEQAEFPDGSAVRLTVSRYYTPTGRCIQKPYENGIEAYQKEESERIRKGELNNSDSIKFNDSLKFLTPAGKTVYGGGGIMPDVFIPIDTIGRTVYFMEVFYKGLLNQYAFEYVDKKRNDFNRFQDFKRFDEDFEVSQAMFKDFIDYAEKNGVKKRAGEIKISEKIMKVYLKALVARNLWKNDGFYPVIHQIDNVFLKAVEILQKENSSAL